MTAMNIVYISIEGNTRSFLTRMAAYAKQQHSFNPANLELNLKEVSDQTEPAEEKEPFFVFVPTYLDGGDGITSVFTEVMTNSLGEYVAYGHNADHCIGIVGSGNRNFNEQYCLTARKYAKQFNAPFLADYELRGTSQDIEVIYKKLMERWNEVQAK
ncbi:class Ib ribonucleoside-diphosphate reductase assembly flavoprotein NrdI [Limosilactobacillus frumenti]|uniref:class Ib ribonucleoside-diphosphate reductase assembly flavoprotein NrdI n=1 Tax=Limosilactobacillus frumenti TaxID=104955 RepID=UPI0015EBED45|nr:class Ib ribonucleoside-diphosphate reductase assembly flavoprotein NrdI [Limosilactobacillus frumenti]MBA2913915.1 class Ib ribonucleoside-diphosphate reductase assembly flavoprotein NrdI [Limosilactobacillus frumenti]